MAGPASQPREKLPVAAIIAAYNREELVVRAVRSALAQRPRPPAEVIVVDDGSTDGTAAAARSAGATVVEHPHNRGAGAARNTAVSATKLRWIAPLDSDDEWLPHHLATLWPARACHVFVAGASLAIDGTGAPRYGGTLSAGPVVLDSPAPLIYPENFVAASGVLFDADVFRAVGGYDTSRRQAEDFDLWIRMLEHGTGLCIPEPVTVYHRHAAQKSSGGQRSRDAVQAIVESYAERAWCSPELIERRLAVTAWDEAREAIGTRRYRNALGRLAWISLRQNRRSALLAALRRRGELRRRGARSQSILAS